MNKSLSAAALCSALVLSLGLATANAQEALSTSDAENSDLYFVELAGKPVADGNTLASVRAVARAIGTARIARTPDSIRFSRFGPT